MGFTCARARASELEHDFAYGCVRQLLEPVIASAPGPERDREFAGAAALALPLFAPSDAAQLAPSSDATFSMLHGLYWLLSNLTDEAPVALAVDDLQWADAESLRLLGYLAPRLDGLPLAVVGSYRSGAGVDAGLARLAAAPETTILRPRPLSIEGAATLCEGRLGTPVTHDFAAACWEATGGNPFFLEALLRETREQRVAPDAHAAARVRRIGPAAVAQAVLLRLSDAPAATSDVVRAVAVLGDGASLAEVACLAEVSEDETARAHDLLAKLELLTPGDTLEFSHPIVREAVYADIGPRERAAAHGRAADVLAAAGASGERIAAQITEAEPAGDPVRVELLRRVAADALGRGAPTAAVAWLRRALTEPPAPASRGEVLLELGSAEQRVVAPGAFDHLTEAIELIREPVLLTRAVRLLGNALTWSRQSDRAVEALQSALSIVEPADPEQALFIEADLAAHAQEASHEARAPAARATRTASRPSRCDPGRTPGAGEPRVRAGESQRVRHRGRGHHRTGTRRWPAARRTGARCPARDLRARGRPHRHGRTGSHGDRAGADARRRTCPGLDPGHRIRARPSGGRFAAAGRHGAGGGRRANGPRAAPRARHPSRCRAVARGADPGARRTGRGRGGRTRAGAERLRGGDPAGPSQPLAARVPRPPSPRPGPGAPRPPPTWWSSAAGSSCGAAPILCPLAGVHVRRSRSPRRATPPGRGGMALDDLDRARRWGAASGIGVALRATALAEGGAACVDRLREAVEVLDGSPARLEQRARPGGPGRRPAARQPPP